MLADDTMNLDTIDEKTIADLCTTLEDCVDLRAGGIDPCEIIDKLDVIGGSLFLEKTSNMRNHFNKWGQPDMSSWRREMLSLIGAIRRLAHQRNIGAHIFRK
jgi:hypothetical protein